MYGRLAGLSATKNSTRPPNLKQKSVAQPTKKKIAGLRLKITPCVKHMKTKRTTSLTHNDEKKLVGKDEWVNESRTICHEYVL